MARLMLDIATDWTFPWLSRRRVMTTYSRSLTPSEGGKQAMCTLRAICRTVLVLGLALVVASIAQATTITFTESFDAYAAVRFPKFDTSLGELNRISFTMESDYFGDFDAFGEGAFLDPGETYELVGRHEARGSAAIWLLAGPPHLGFRFVMPGDLRCSVTNTGDTRDFFSCDTLNYGGGAYDDVFTVDPRDHDLFLWDYPWEQFNVTMSTDVDASCTASHGSCWVVSELRWDGSLTLAYTFNEEPPGIPEPGAFMLLILGLTGLGFARRRRL